MDDNFIDDDLQIENLEHHSEGVDEQFLGSFNPKTFGESGSLENSDDDACVTSLVEKLQERIHHNGEDLGIAFGARYNDSEINKMKHDVNMLEHEVSNRKSDVSNWESKVSLNDTREHRENGDYSNAVRHLNEAKSRYNNAVDRLNNARSKLNNAM